MARHVRAVPDASPALSAAEASTLADLHTVARPPTWLGRFLQAFRHATGTVTRSEFDRVCFKVIEELNGTTQTPEDAQAKAARLIQAFTQAHAGVIVPKCDYSDQAVLVAWLGDPRSGFLFQKAFTLKDPKGVKRGP